MGPDERVRPFLFWEKEVGNLVGGKVQGGLKSQRYR